MVGGTSSYLNYRRIAFDFARIRRFSLLLRQRKAMSSGLRIWLRVFLLWAIVLLCFTEPLCANIYQWEWIDPLNHSLGKQQSLILCTDGAGVNAAPGAFLSFRNLAQTYLVSANLTDASVFSATLTNAYMPQANLAYANLSSTLFTNADLTGANFSHANLYSATLSGAILNDAVLQGAILTATTSKGFAASQLYSTASYISYDLRGIKLDANNLTAWNFGSQNLTGADFSSSTPSTLTNTVFSNANLTNAKLNSTSLGGTILSGAVVQGANFSNTTSGGFAFAQLESTASYIAHNLTGINLSSNSMSAWNFADQTLTNAVFTSANLSSAVFSNADLTSAVLSSATLTSANLGNANLTNAKLNSSTLTSASLGGAVVLGADFSSTTSTGFTDIMLYSTASYGAYDLRGIKLASNNLTGWIFDDQNLTGASFASATLTSATLTDALVQGANFSNTTSIGFTKAMLESTASYAAHELAGINLASNNLATWNFNNQDLIGANFSAATVTSATFADAVVQGANFNNTTSKGFTKAMLESTASWIDKNLQGIILDNNNLSNWNFAGQNLTNSSFASTTKTSTNFTAADTRRAQSLTFSGAITTNTIRPDGKIQFLNLAGAQTLVVRDYDGDPSRSLGPLPIMVTNGMTMGTNGILQTLFEEDAWDSTISFDPGITVALGGSLNLTFAQDVDILGQLGRTFSVFNWSGVSPTGTFNVTSPYEWDTSKLYNTGEVTLIFDRPVNDTHWTGTTNENWTVAGNWTDGAPVSGSVVFFDQAAPPNHPMVQNIADPLSLEGIVFTAAAGTHLLDGQTLQLMGSTPMVFSSSDNDHHIGNPLELAADATFVINGTGKLYLDGAIDGSGSLSKKGPGELILTNNGTYLGNTVIEEGVFSLDSGVQIENSAIENNATFQNLTGDNTVKTITGAGATEVLSGSLTAESVAQDSLYVAPGAKLILAAAAPAQQISHWTGASDSNWSNAGNWTGGAPGAGAKVVFDAVAPANQPSNQNIANPLTLNGIDFTSDSGAHTLNGQNLQLIDTAPEVTCASANNQRIDNTLDLSVDTTFAVSGAGTLTLAGPISGSSGLLKSGSGMLVLQGVGSFAGDTTIEAGILAIGLDGQIVNSAIVNNATFQTMGVHTVNAITGAGTTEVIVGTLTVD